MTAVDSAMSGPSDQSPKVDLPLLVFLLALPVGIVARVAPGWDLPLWVDETFTGTIASQADFQGLLRWCLSELTGPAFYMPMWVWVKVAGSSDLALRLPSLTFSIAAPLLIARYGHPDRAIRLFWAALMLLWLPILPAAFEARPYPQLMFLGTLQAILFLKLAKSAKPGLAFWWGTVTAFAVLTHSYALVIGGLQGLALLIGHRRNILRLYPAVFPLILMAAWMAYHLPFVLGFASGHVEHYDPVPPSMIFALPMVIMGDSVHGYVILLFLALSAKYWTREIQIASPEAQLIWAGVGTTVLLIVIGFIGATLMPRYLTPGIPALLFGLACWAGRMTPRNPMHVRLVFVAVFAGMLIHLIGKPTDIRFRERRYFQFETASAWLIERRPGQLFFLWATPTGAQSPSANLAEVAGFFFRRAKAPVEVVVERGGPDPNRALTEAAAGNPRAAILWISDNPHRKRVRPDIMAIDPRWECRDFGGEKIIVYACRRRLP